MCFIDLALRGTHCSGELFDERPFGPDRPYGDPKFLGAILGPHHRTPRRHVESDYSNGIGAVKPSVEQTFCVGNLLAVNRQLPCE